MNRGELEFLAEIVRARTGLVLSADKAYLLEGRLGPVARREGFDTVEALVAKLRTRRDDRLASSVAEAMAATETWFFRDRDPFTQLADEVIPELAAARRPDERLRIWCAGCSTGQEAYSLAMMLEDLRALTAGRMIEIIATDMSGKAIEKAKAGLYSHYEVQRGLPIGRFVRYFEKAGEMWRISPDLRRDIHFQKLNLLEDFSHLGRFDVVLCRNVLAYFDRETKIEVLGRIAAQTSPDARLVLGASETLVGLTDAFSALKGRGGVYGVTAAEDDAERAA